MFSLQHIKILNYLHKKLKLLLNIHEKQHHFATLAQVLKFSLLMIVLVVPWVTGWSKTSKMR